MRICPECNNPMNANDKCQTCGWTRDKPKANGNPYPFGIRIGTEWIDKQCGYDDHGKRCQRIGHMAMSTNGEGPWYCRTHFARLMGWSEDLAEPTRINGLVSTPVVDELLKKMKRRPSR